MGLRQEIAQQPEVVARLLTEAPADLAPIAAAVRRRRIQHVVLGARGSSDHAAVYAQYAIGAIARLPVGLTTPSLFSRYGRPPRIGRSLAVAISQSGRSPDILEFLVEARRQGAVTVAITNDEASPLAAEAEHAVPLRAGPELAVAATKTYTAQLAAVALLAAALSGDRRARAALDELPAAMSAALGADAAAAEAAARHRSMRSCVVLGRGFNLATALEWALKLRELAHVQAHGYSTADFEHGPVASLGPGDHVLAVAAGQVLRDDLVNLLERLRGERRVRSLSVGELPTDDVLGTQEMVSEWLSPAVTIIPAQLFCYHLARAKGLSTESPRGLQKVTLTR